MLSMSITWTYYKWTFIDALMNSCTCHCQKCHKSISDMLSLFDPHDCKFAVVLIFVLHFFSAEMCMCTHSAQAFFLQSLRYVAMQYVQRSTTRDYDFFSRPTNNYLNETFYIYSLKASFSVYSFGGKFAIINLFNIQLDSWNLQF